jgi:hypothetical protein
MAQQFDALQGKLHAIKRDGHRPSISGVPPGLVAVRAAIPSSAEDLPTIGGLAARLESLKRENARPSFIGTTAQPIQLEAAGHSDTSALSRAAVQLFGDKDFVAMCEHGMSAQLTRSKDGATEETKIKELAGMLMSQNLIMPWGWPLAS